jgi:DNA-binding NtrC family response regulator
VLEDQRVRRLGGKSEIQLDVRVIAATNAPLDSAIRDGRFREDLYYRLNVFPIPLPPLRERKDDIPLLVEALVANVNHKHGTKVTDVSQDVIARLRAYDWPGNIRELRNVIERAAIIAGEGTVHLAHLPATVTGTRAASAAAHAVSSETTSAQASAADGLHVPIGWTIEQAERALIERTLEHTGNNRTRAAEILGISQKTLFNKLKEYATEGGE